jgi:hypothetical protein
MGPKNMSTPIKPLEVSSITQEENEDIHNNLSKLEEQLNDLSAKSITRDELVNSQRKIQEMDEKTNENKNEMKITLDDMKNKMYENKVEIQKSWRNCKIPCRP